MKFKIYFTISIFFISLLKVFPSASEQKNQMQIPLNILVVVDEKVDKFSYSQNDTSYLLEAASLS